MAALDRGKRGRCVEISMSWWMLMHSGVDVPLEQNDQLNQTLAEFMKPIITRSTLMSDGYGMLSGFYIHVPDFI
jgi:hypothetical protein